MGGAILGRGSTVVTAKKLARKLDRGAERIQPALVALVELRRAIEDGKPMCVQLLFIEELQEALFIVEDCVGVRTPTALFE
jgi:hypothetical protein